MLVAVILYLFVGSRSLSLKEDYLIIEKTESRLKKEKEKEKEIKKVPLFICRGSSPALLVPSQSFHHQR
jgi:hypothetical protein